MPSETVTDARTDPSGERGGDLRLESTAEGVGVLSPDCDMPGVPERSSPSATDGSDAGGSDGGVGGAEGAR